MIREARELKAGVLISRARLNKAFLQYESEYMAAEKALTENGYLVDGGFEWVYGVLINEYPYFTNKLLVSQITGKAEITSRRLEYALKVMDLYRVRAGYTEFKKFADLLYDWIKAKEVYSQLKEIQGLRFKECTEQSVTVVVNTDNGVRDISKYKFNFDGVRESFARRKGSRLVFVNTKLLQYYETLTACGVRMSVSEINTADKGYFCVGLSVEEEVRFLEMLLTGSVSLDGRCGSRLKKFVLMGGEYGVKKDGLARTVGADVYIRSIRERGGYDSAEKTKLEKEGLVTVFYLSDGGVYFEVGGETGVFSDDASCEALEVNAVNGGISKPEADVWKGVPKVINGYDDLPILVNKKSRCVFENTGRFMMLRKFRELVNSVKYVEKVFTDGYKDLVAELCCALELFDGGADAYTFMYSEWSFVDEQMYIRACSEAAQIRFRN